MKLIILMILSFFLYIAPNANANEFGLFGEPLPTPVIDSYQTPSYVTPNYGTPSYNTPSGDDGGSGAPAGEVSSSGGADFDENGKVDIFDLSIFLRNWNKSGKGDLNGSSTIDIFDLSILLRSWTI